jgi:hypothetical protein
MVGQPAVTTPTATVYVPSVLARYRSEITAARAQFTAALANPAAGQMGPLMETYFDGLLSAVTDSERVIVTLDVTKDQGGIDFALVPKTDSRLAQFVALQHPSDYALFDKLPSSEARLVMGGHVESGPYRNGMLDVMKAVYAPGVGNTKDLIDAVAALMSSSTGDIAMAMQLAPNAGMTMTQLFGIADRPQADKAVDNLLAIFRTGRTFDMLGIGTTMKTAQGAKPHDGTVDLTYDFSKAPAPTRAAMQTMIPNGVTSTRIVTFDQLGLIAMAHDSASAATRAIDAARGKTPHVTAAPIAKMISASRARKESVVMVFDLAGLLGKLSAAPAPLMMSLGFADHNAHIRIAAPAATIRTMTGKPSATTSTGALPPDFQF